MAKLVNRGVTSKTEVRGTIGRDGPIRLVSPLIVGMGTAGRKQKNREAIGGFFSEHNTSAIGGMFGGVQHRDAPRCRLKKLRLACTQDWE